MSVFSKKYTHTMTLFGKKVGFNIIEPDNEQYNAFSDAVQEAVRDESDEKLQTARAKYFDLWVTEVEGREKASIPDRMKSIVMHQTFERVVVEEKN